MPNFFGKEISGSFTIPSGIITTNRYTMGRIARDVPQVGVVITKSTRKNQRKVIGNQYFIVLYQEDLEHLEMLLV
ncbi:MAG: hypothetical protein ISS36_01450 [Candidatus Aenigmarchaeota archaeon]|nr:hypothetical protein [Candidatus Aenigmarchaeota archaeon]